MSDLAAARALFLRALAEKEAAETKFVQVGRALMEPVAAAAAQDRRLSERPRVERRVRLLALIVLSPCRNVGCARCLPEAGAACRPSGAMLGRGRGFAIDRSQVQGTTRRPRQRCRVHLSQQSACSSGSNTMRSSPV